MREEAGVYEFVGIGEVAETTTHMLELSLQQALQPASRRGGGLGQIEQLVLQQARDYLSTVREGFMLSVRTTQVGDYSELGYLLERVLTDWDRFSEELGLGPDREDQPDPRTEAPLVPEGLRVERVRRQLLAFGMAAVAMGALPRLPAKQVTFPPSYGKPPTYSDISAPHTPGEMLWRIEEVEQTLWQMMSQDIVELVRRRYGPLRRTYGFFEASAWLTRKEAQRFGVKKRRLRPA